MRMVLLVLVSVNFPNDQLHRCTSRSKTSSSLAQNCCLLETILVSEINCRDFNKATASIQNCPNAHLIAFIPVKGEENIWIPD